MSTQLGESQVDQEPEPPHAILTNRWRRVWPLGAGVLTYAIVHLANGDAFFSPSLGFTPIQWFPVAVVIAWFFSVSVLYLMRDRSISSVLSGMALSTFGLAASWFVVSWWGIFHDKP